MLNKVFKQHHGKAAYPKQNGDIIDRNKEIGLTIVEQLRASVDIISYASWGVKMYVIIDKGIKLICRNNYYIIISLNGWDLYDITIGKYNKRTCEFKVKAQYSNVYADTFGNEINEFMYHN